MAIPEHTCKDEYYKVVKNQEGFFNCVKAVCQICGRESFVRHLKEFESQGVGTFKVE
jgi:hypothetical protein